MLPGSRKLYPGQRTNVIFVAMSYDNCFNFVAPSFDKCGIRYNFLDAKFIIAECMSNIQHKTGISKGKRELQHFSQAELTTYL